jgi:hypothetical protein
MNDFSKDMDNLKQNKIDFLPDLNAEVVSNDVEIYERDLEINEAIKNDILFNDSPQLDIENILAGKDFVDFIGNQN